ncbi:thiolase-like protein [Trametopsis cervina]|nr:thiolase-like protein [Trametopsis cervina]
MPASVGLSPSSLPGALDTMPSLMREALKGPSGEHLDATTLAKLAAAQKAKIGAQKMPEPSIVPADIDVQVLGLGVAYPPDNMYPDQFDELTARLVEPTPAIQKMLAINRKTGIEKRSILYNAEHEFHSGKAPTIDLISDAFRKHAVPLAGQAARKALADANVDASELTHVVCCTVTDSSNPGFDVDLVNHLGLADAGIERYLLAGVGCAGGLATIRTATNVILAAKAVGRPATVLVVATEVVSPFATMELERAQKSGEVNVAATLFSDCASALVMSYAGGRSASALSSPASSASSLEELAEEKKLPKEEGVYSLYAYSNWTLPDTHSLLRYNVNSHGWNVVLSPKLPALTSGALEPALRKLLVAAKLTHLNPAEFDWAVHPGGAAILKACGEKMGLADDDQLRASWGVYTKHGNSSSATIFSVLEALRAGKHAADVLGAGEVPKAESAKPREWVAAVAFGPGVTLEMAILKRRNLERN